MSSTTVLARELCSATKDGKVVLSPFSVKPQNAKFTVLRTVESQLGKFLRCTAGLRFVREPEAPKIVAAKDLVSFKRGKIRVIGVEIGPEIHPADRATLLPLFADIRDKIRSAREQRFPDK